MSSVCFTVVFALGAVSLAVAAIRGWARVIAGRPENLPPTIDYDLRVGGAVLCSVFTVVLVGLTILLAGVTASFVKSRRHQD